MLDPDDIFVALFQNMSEPPPPYAPNPSGEKMGQPPPPAGRLGHRFVTVS